MPLFREMKVPVPVEEVLRRLGKRKRTAISPELARRVNEEIDRCQRLMSPRGLYERFEISLERPDVVMIPGLHSIESADLYRWVEGCGEIVVMVVTVGDEIARRAEDLVRAREVTRAMIVDAIGSETVEELANVLNRIVDNTVRKPTTRRYSPGYGDWRVTDQGILLDLVRAERIGVTVNEASQMIPEKSISAVIGLRDPARRAGERTARDGVERCGRTT